MVLMSESAVSSEAYWALLIPSFFLSVDLSGEMDELAKLDPTDRCVRSGQLEARYGPDAPQVERVPSIPPRRRAMPGIHRRRGK